MKTLPVVKLIGRDGNAFAILGACKKAWIKNGGTVDEWEKIRQEMTSGDYNHLLKVAMDHFEVR